MRPRRTAALAALALALGCGGPGGGDALTRRCARAVAKVQLEAHDVAAGAEPRGAEAAIIAAARAAAIAACRAEGLSEAQAACFEPIIDIETLFEAADCPAIAAAPPSWFQVPPPDVRREALARMRARAAPTPDAAP